MVKLYSRESVFLVNALKKFVPAQYAEQIKTALEAAGLSRQEIFTRIAELSTFLDPTDPIGQYSKLFRAKALAGKYNLERFAQFDLQDYIPELYLNEDAPESVEQELTEYIDFMRDSLEAQLDPTAKRSMRAMPALHLDAYVTDPVSKCGESGEGTLPENVIICKSEGKFWCLDTLKLVEQLKSNSTAINYFTNEPLDPEIVENLRQRYAKEIMADLFETPPTSPAITRRKAAPQPDRDELEQARKQPTTTDAVKLVAAEQKKEVSSSNLASVVDIKIAEPKGAIAARIYTPKNTSKGGKSPLPVVVYFHGGGFVLADNDVYDATPRALAEQTGAIFVSVEYRKAPEHKFPAAHEDAFVAYKWVLNNIAKRGGDAQRVAVAGEGAGANLALNVAIRARDENILKPVHELLIYPVASANLESDSYKTYAMAKPLSKPIMEWYFKQYVRTAADAQDPRLNLVAANLKNLYPATIITAEIDPLRDDGKALAQKFKADGVDVVYKNFYGVTHDFFGMAAVVKEAKKAQKLAVRDLRTSFKW